MSQQQASAKPSLQGVRLKDRKRTVKASAKHEPATFRDQLYKYLESVSPTDFDAVSNKLIQAGSTLDYTKYAESLFEILFVGGLLQSGGTVLEDGAPVSPFAVVNAKEPTEVDDVKPYVEVFNKVIRRYKYLQKPLEEAALPHLFQYTNRWPTSQKEKFAIAVGLLLAQGLVNAAALQALTKDHLVKNGQHQNRSGRIISLIFKAFLKEQSMDQLASSLKKGGIKDIASFFPANKRDPKSLEAHFKAYGLPQVSEWYIKRQNAGIKETIVKTVHEMCDADNATDEILSYLKQSQTDSPVPEADLVQCIWQGCVASVDWSARPDQIEGLAVREVGKFALIMEPFCTTAKTQVSLINIVQVHCYEDTRVIKAFPQILKVLYNKDCISDEAIIYWSQKGAKPQGKQHFLKAAEPLVKFLQSRDEDSEEE